VTGFSGIADPLCVTSIKLNFQSRAGTISLNHCGIYVGDSHRAQWKKKKEKKKLHSNSDYKDLLWHDSSIPPYRILTLRH
jgi:hypothetical protein